MIMRRHTLMPSRYRLLRRLLATVSGGHAALLLLTPVPWVLSLALLAVIGIGAGLWTLGVIACLRAEEDGAR
jgi:hypothetical protein